MKAVLLSLLLGLFFMGSKAQNCDIATGGVSIVNANNTAPALSGCVGQVLNFKFYIANLGTSPTCVIPANSVTAVFDFPTLAGNVKPYIYNGPASFSTGHFTWTYDPVEEVLVGTNTTAIPNGDGDVDILVPVIGNAPGGTASSALNLTQGGATSDNTSNNTGSAQLTINPSPATPTVSVIQPTCSTPTGTITVNTPTGGNITYSIDGTNYQASNIFNNVAPGNYNVTAKNTTSACASAATPVTINAASASPAAPTVSVTQPTCTVATGTITVNSPTGGDITYSIDGTTYQSSNVFSNVAPGNYNVTAKNTTSGCVSAATPITINAQPATPATPTVSVIQPTCTVATGTITVNTPTGGNITYSIDGTNYQSSNIFNNVAPGNYNVTAKNTTSGCVSTATPVVINVAPTSPATPTVTVTQPTCTVATGTITVNTPTGGDITYSIDGTTYQSSNIFNNVAPGNYNVTAKNTTSGCVSASTPVTINAQPGAPATPTVSVIQPTCSTPTGTITVNTPTGGDITYSIDGTTYQSSNIFNNVAPGNYNVTAKNTTSGCVSASTPVTINAQPATPATPTVTVTQPTCTVATGTITVNTPTGGDITYSIDGTTYQSSNVFSNVAPGSYNVTAKNTTSGCVSAATPVTINAQPGAPATPTVSVIQPSCTVATGTITVNTPTGGDITYSIDGTNYQSSNIFNNVAPGNYNVTAKNTTSGCISASTPVTINAQPATPATPTVSVTQPTCSAPTGTITVNTPTGGDITYSIDGTTYQSSNIFNNVAPGNYNVTAKNTTSGCVSASTPVTINAQPGAPATPTVSVIQPTCSTPTGTITVNTPTGGDITYSIDGTTYQSSNIFNNVAPGNYNVTAKNTTSGCVSASTPVTINAQPATPATPTVSVIQPSCTVATGTITVNTPTGGDITYSIDGTTYQSSNIFNNVAPGNYNVTAKNTTSGCISASTPVTINAQPGATATPTVTVTQPTCTTPTGTITVNTPMGGNITYSIDGTNYQSSNIFNNVAPGNYNVTAKNTTTGCVSTATPVTINAQPGAPATPTVTVTQPTCTVATGTITVNTPTGGDITYSIDGTNYQSSNVFNNVAPGNYNVTAKNTTSGCVSAATPVTINTQPATPAAPTVSVIQPTCTTPTGTITVNTPTGGNITYSIDGINYQSSNVFSNVAPGSYNVTAKNTTSGCVSAATPVTINAAPTSPATPTVTVTQPTCTVATGTITVNSPTGLGITYSIDGTNYQSSNVFNNVAPGNYNVTAKNIIGCVSVATPVTINAQPATPATPTVTVTQPTCTVATGTITVNTPTGGNITYSIDGTNYQSSNIFNNVAPGNYNVTAKNTTSGCVSAATPVTINAQPGATATPTVSVTQPTCSTPTGTITVNTPTGGNITYSIDGTNYQSSNIFNNVAPGNYNVTAKNTTSGCVSAATPVVINAAPASPATPTVSVIQPTCSTPTGTITVNTPMGGDITYSIDGTNYQSSNVFSNVAPGNYNVTAKNTTSGCVSAATPVTINAQPGATATPTVSVIQPTCSTPTGTITVNSPTGGDITYSIDGTNYQSSNVFSNVAPGNYNVTAKNITSGCVSASTPVTINAAPSSPATPTVSVIQPTCSTPTGTITVNTPTGGDITYSIDGTNYQSSNIFNNVAPGNYNVTAKNTTSGCISVATPVTINTQPATPSTPTVSVTQPTCSTPTGTITVNTPTGGNITYSIDGTNYQSSNIFNNVAPGNYNVTAKNTTSGCVSASTPVTISAAPASPATPTVSVIQPTCSTPTGTITVNTPTGGNITYSIDGTNYQSSNIFNNVAPGNYNVTAKNTTSGCVSAATPVTINAQPGAPATPTVSVTQPTCSTPTGTITVNTPTGGNITYSIDGTNYQSSNVFSNVAPGNYNVTAKNTTSGCVSASTPVTINAGSADNQAPTITLKPSPTVFLNAANTYTVQLSDVVQSVTDNCDPNPNATISTLTVTCANLGSGGGSNTPHQPFVANSPTGNQNFQGELGMDFRVNAANGIVINQLGAFDHQGDGIMGTQPDGNGNFGIRVAIFSKATQAIVPGLSTVIVGNGDSYSGNYRYKNIPAVNLPQGDYIVIAKGYNANELEGNSYLGGGPYPQGDDASGAITYLNTAYYGADNPAGFSYPTGSLNVGTSSIYKAGTFTYALSQSNTVTVTATDASNNQSQVNVSVTVVDTFYVLTTKDITVALNNSGQATIQPIAVLQSLKNNCGIDVTTSTLQVSPNSFNCSNISGGSVPSAASYYPFVANNPIGNQNFQGELGMDFRVNAANGISINQLGAFDHQGDGIIGTQPDGNGNFGIRVAIFSKTTQAIVPGLSTVIVGNGDSYSGNYRYKNIPAVTLPQGDYIVIAKGYNANELEGNSYMGGGPYPQGDDAGGAISYLNFAYYGDDNPSGFSYPTGSINVGTSSIYKAGTFVYKTLTTGANVVTLTATDVYGHQKQATANVWVVDNTGPMIVTKNITLPLDNTGNASITPNDVLQSPITDNCGVNNASISVSPSSFTCADYSSGGGGTPRQPFIANSSAGNQVFQGELGMDFRVNAASGIVITQLGAFDDQGNGITGTQPDGNGNFGIRVAIFNKATQAIVPGLSAVIVGNADSYSGNYRYKNIPAVNLPQGDYIVIAKGYNAAEPEGNSYMGGGPYPQGDDAGGAISYLNTAYYGADNPSGFSYPTGSLNVGTSNIYKAGTFTYALGLSNSKTVTVTATDTHGNTSQQTAVVTLTNPSGSCGAPPVMTYAAKSQPTDVPVVLDNVSMSIKVYPNPSSGLFSVQLLNAKAATVTLQIMDANGKVIVQKNAAPVSKTSSLTIPVDISKHASGIYLIKVISTDGIQTTKIVVSR